MNQLNDLYGAFSIQFKMEGEPGLIHIIPEMAPATVGLKPLGSYFIYLVHPEHGSVTFTIEQDKSLQWFCDQLPPFIDPLMVIWIGKTIEESKDEIED